MVMSVALAPVSLPSVPLKDSVWVANAGAV
jgi:hypothetical protein